MSETPNLGLPFIEAAQAQKHVPHNEALRHLDIRVQARVINRTTSGPPTSAQEADAYVVGANAIGDWAGKENQIAAFQDGTWAFYPIVTGHIVWFEDDQSLAVWTGSEWLDVNTGVIELQNLDHVGINATADATNKLAVSSQAVLFTHAGNGIQNVLNKNTVADTASVLFQTNWSGRAEMGLAGDDDFHFKVSPDGSNFFEAIKIDKTDGSVRFPSGAHTPNTEFGDGSLVNTDYVAARGQDLVTNGSGMLANTYNMPDSFEFDGANTPGLPGSFIFSGYMPGVEQTSELMAVDPNQVYQLQIYMNQQSVAGDWSAYANGERHLQYAGLACFDVDKQLIGATHHMRYHHAGIDSLTTLAAPLAPGDTTISLVDASGWNETSPETWQRAIIIFEYANSLGFKYDYYSRIRQSDMFELSGVDKSTNTITLNKPLPAAFGNPDDINGQWPAGSKIANGSSGGSYKYSLFSSAIVPSTDRWFQYTNFQGGLDISGGNATQNFSPGTAYCRFFWLPNYSNRPGGTLAGYPDTGADAKLLFSGISVTKTPIAHATENADGSNSLLRFKGNPATGDVSFVPTALEVLEV